MSTQPVTAFSYSPTVQSLIPLFYAAWSDQVLSPSEVKTLQMVAGELDLLSEEDKRILLNWSDPSKPPSRHLFKYWEIELKRSTELVSNSQRNSLVDLGLAMARKAEKEAQNGHPSIDWSSPAIRESLEKLEEALKSINIGTYQSIFEEESEIVNRKQEKRKASFDIEKMAELLDGRNPELRQRMRTLFQDPIFRYRTLPNKEAYREQVLAWCKLLAEQGLGAISYPKAYGGEDSMDKYATVFEMLGYHDLSLTIKFGVQFGLFGGSILWLGTERHHKKYLKDIGTLQLPGCFAMTETGHGSNVRGLETTATYDKETREFIIHTPSIKAGKEYIGNALQGRMASVFAQLIIDGENQGVHAILVTMRNENGKLLPGIRVEDCGYKMGLNGVDNGRIWFNKVRVPRENLLNRFGDVDEKGNYSSPIENPSRRFFTMLGTLVGGRVCVPRAGLSAAKSALTIAIDYSLRRRQFAPSFKEPETILMDYPSHQRRLMPLLAKAYALHFALSYLTDRYVNRSDADIREIETLAAGMKAYSTWFTTAAIQECREACGGKGYLSENRIPALKADTDIFTTFEGDNTVLMQLVAKGVFSKFRKEFHEDGNRAILRYLGDRVSTAITEKNPFIIRNTDADHLRDSDFHLNAFRFREKRLVYSLAQRMRGLIKAGDTSHTAFLKCQTHMITLAEAFIERVILEQFVDIVEKQANQALQSTLKNLCDLFALHTIETHKGWYLEQEYMLGSKTRAIRRVVDQLCGKLRNDASGLIASFAIPEECLGADIIRNNKLGK